MTLVRQKPKKKFFRLKAGVFVKLIRVYPCYSCSRNRKNHHFSCKFRRKVVLFASEMVQTVSCRDASRHIKRTATSLWVGGVRDISEMRPKKPFVRPVSEGVYERYVLCIQTSQLWNSPQRYRNDKRLRLIDYSCLIGVPTWVYCVSMYIVIWRGLAALLILGEGQCEGLNAGISRRAIHAFFISLN